MCFAIKIGHVFFRSNTWFVNLKRVFMSGEGVDVDTVDTAPKHDQVPNMKLVMNPEGKHKQDDSYQRRAQWIFNGIRQIHPF